MCLLKQIIRTLSFCSAIFHSIDQMERAVALYEKRGISGQVSAQDTKTYWRSYPPSVFLKPSSPPSSLGTKSQIHVCTKGLMRYFSGDDHDYCEYTHYLSLRNAPIQETKEVTVKTISMVMNVRRPGFQLLSLAPALLRSETSETLAERPCVLPDQLRIYLQLYIPSLITSLFIVFLVSLRHRSTFHNKADSNLAEVHLLSDIEEGTGDAVESTFTSSRRQPTSSGRLNSRTTTINPGWRIAPEERYSKSNSFNVSEWLCGFADVILSASGRSRGPSSRRSWLLTFLRDVRDVAVFPIAIFIFITWWTVSN